MLAKGLAVVQNEKHEKQEQENLLYRHENPQFSSWSQVLTLPVFSFQASLLYQNFHHTRHLLLPPLQCAQVL